MVIKTRASLGHTCGAPIAERTITAICVLLFASSAMRIMSPYTNNGTMFLYGAAGGRKVVSSPHVSAAITASTVVTVATFCRA